MKNNYVDFVNDYNDVKNKAIEMSSRLNSINKSSFNMKLVPPNDITMSLDSMSYGYDVELHYTEYNRCDNDEFYFNIPLNILFDDDKCDEYIKTEEDKIEQRKLKIKLEKEEKLRLIEQQRKLNELKKIEDDKKKLLELIEKYPELVKK